MNRVRHREEHVSESEKVTERSEREGGREASQSRHFIFRDTTYGVDFPFPPSGGTRAGG